MNQIGFLSILDSQDEMNLVYDLYLIVHFSSVLIFLYYLYFVYEILLQVVLFYF